MSEPMTLNESLEKLHESIAGLGRSLTVALIPAIGTFQTIAVQIAAEAEKAIGIALNNFQPFDWENLDITMTRNHPWRYEDESLVDWGNRLERAGLLDKYEYRLMYGEECWRAVLHSPVWAMKKALALLERVLTQ
jgi:hypothetical protein